MTELKALRNLMDAAVLFVAMAQRGDLDDVAVEATEEYKEITEAIHHASEVLHEGDAHAQAVDEAYRLKRLRRDASAIYSEGLTCSCANCAQIVPKLIAAHHQEGPQS